MALTSFTYQVYQWFINKRPVFCPFALYSLLTISACENQQINDRLLILDGLTMGTAYTVKISDKSPALNTEKLKRDINSILNEVDQKMSTYIADSELSKINQTATTDRIEISEELFTVIEKAITIGQLTNGTFDITVGPVVNLWGFGPQNQPEHVPPDEDIQLALATVGYQYLHLQQSPTSLKKDRKDIYIDLSGIAKGYAVDRIAEYLETSHCRNFMVEIGGEIRAQGTNEKGKLWRIGIEKPLINQRSVQRIIKLDNISMATSGDYRNYFELDGVRYSHTINPQTGRPITHNLASVTIVHRSAAVADALATGLQVMGPELGYELAVKENLAALFIISSEMGFEEKHTAAFKPFLLDK